MKQPLNLTEKQKTVIWQWAANDMRIPETSYALDCHRNTVVYNLRQVKLRTGLDPTRFYDLVRLLVLLHEEKGA